MSYPLLEGTSVSNMVVSGDLNAYQINRRHLYLRNTPAHKQRASLVVNVETLMCFIVVEDGLTLCLTLYQVCRSHTDDKKLI